MFYVISYVMWGTFFWNFTFVMTTTFNLLPYFLSIWFSPLCFLLSFSLNVRCGQSVSFEVIVDPSTVSPCLNYRQCNDLENIQKIMISMYLSVLISNAMTRQHEQNMIDLNKHVFPSWQINEREDIVKLTCFFKNWTRDELHIISKLLLTTNLVIPEESKGIKQRKESGNLAKEAIIGLNANKH